MGVTISTHRGRGSQTVHRNHNRRTEHVVDKEEHIIKGGTYEIWLDEDPRSAYERLFGESVAEYNKKQKRADRQIESYYDKVQNSKDQQPVYELIIGIYGKDEHGNPLCSHELGKEIMKQYVDEWKERNPQLELIGAYYHADEIGSEPHVHIDYIPVADGYTKGMKKRTGATKAFEQMGFETTSTKDTGLIKWTERENAYFTRIIEDRGIVVDHPREEGRKHYKQDKWRELKAREAAEKAEKRLEELEGRIVKAEELVDERIGRDFLGRPKEKVTMSREEFLNLHQTASSVKDAQAFQMSAGYNNRLAQEAREIAEKRKAEYEEKLDNLDNLIAERAVEIYREELERKVHERGVEHEINSRDGFMKQFKVGDKSIFELFKEEQMRLDKVIQDKLKKALSRHISHDFDIGDDDGLR